MTATAARPGALPAEWVHWQGLGLTADLLPVVANSSAVISPNSSMKALGKTPSMYNRGGHAVGIPEWTAKQTTDAEVARWSANIDLGICIQTRYLRAIDIDIGDPTHAQAVADFVLLLTGDLPVRVRSNSGKRLLIFFMRGEFAKRIIHTAHGIVEFLANGQQFVACGTHSSGVRYEWPGGLPKRIPTLSPQEFADAWAGLQAAHGTEPERMARGGLVRPTVTRDALSVNDPVTQYLEDNLWSKGWTQDGRMNIECPWSDQHTVNSDASATQYFPAGVGGFARGHFHCLHAHCVGRLDGDFASAIGVVASEFEDVSADSATGGALAVLDGTPAPDVPKPAFQRNKDGSIKATVTNLLMAVRRPDVCDVRVAWDVFKDELVWATPGGGADWRPFGDHDYTRLRDHLQRNSFSAIGREMIRDVVHLVAVENRFDSAQVWIRGLKWDGISRVKTFFQRYFGATDTPYARAVSLYTWSALAGRAESPGVKADMVPILKSAQGTVKTEGVIAISPHEDFFVELDLSKSDDTLARSMRGKLVGEISELRGLNSRDQEAIKAWTSRRFEEWIPKFKEFGTKFARRFVAIGTTNEDEILADSTGERRWLPIRVGRTDLAALRADREQLWAEGATLFLTHGVLWEDAETLAKAEHAQFKVLDSWNDIISTWLNTEAFGQPEGVRQGDQPLRIHEVLQSAIGMNAQSITRKDELRVAKALRLFGYEKTMQRVGTQFFKVWTRR